jgi:ferrous iron transport protein B
MILYATGAMDAIANFLEGFLAAVFGVPSGVSSALVVGFLRKDLAIGLLEPVGMTTYQMFTSVVLLSIYFPCLATFAMLLKELNWKEILSTIGVLIVAVFVFGGILHGVGLIGGWY